MSVSGATVAGPVLVTTRSARGRATVVVAVLLLLVDTGSTCDPPMLAVAVFEMVEPSVAELETCTLIDHWSVWPLVSPAMEQVIVWPRPHAVGGSPGAKSKPTKVTPLGSVSLTVTLLAASGP